MALAQLLAIGGSVGCFFYWLFFAIRRRHGLRGFLITLIGSAIAIGVSYYDRFEHLALLFRQILPTFIAGAAFLLIGLCVIMLLRARRANYRAKPLTYQAAQHIDECAECRQRGSHVKPYKIKQRKYALLCNDCAAKHEAISAA